VRNHPLLWISSLISGVNCCSNLEQQVEGWVEHMSQAFGCTTIVKRYVFYLITVLIYVFKLVYMNFVYEKDYMLLC
jgi:hypothetical protein